MTSDLVTLHRNCDSLMTDNGLYMTLCIAEYMYTVHCAEYMYSIQIQQYLDFELL